MDGGSGKANDTSYIAGTHCNRVTVEPIRPHHASILPRVREADIIEAAKLTNIPYQSGLCYTIASADMGYAILYDGIVEAVCGVGRNNDPWLAGTDEIARHPATFFRVSRNIINEMKSRYDWLCNWVDDDNKLSIRWLEWAGFHIDEAREVGNGLFRRFYWER